MGQLSQRTKSSISKLGIQPLPKGYQKKGKYYHYPKEGVKVSYYTLVLRPDQVDNYLSSIKFRKQHPEELIQIRYVDVKKEQMEYCKMVIFYEYIPVNMEKIVSLNFNNMLSVLYFSLKGFQKLLQHWGSYFTVQSYMIGINSQGQVKVWLSRNYWQQSAKPSYLLHKNGSKEVAEKSMVNQLKEIFKCKTDKETIPPRFELQSENFQDLMKEIQDKVGKRTLVNNIPTSKELSQSDKSERDRSEELNEKIYKDPSIKDIERKEIIQDNLKPIPNTNYKESKVVQIFSPQDFYKPDNPALLPSKAPKIKFNYDKEIPQSMLLPPRTRLTSTQSASKLPPNQKINFSYKSRL